MHQLLSYQLFILSLNVTSLPSKAVLFCLFGLLFVGCGGGGGGGLMSYGYLIRVHVVHTVPVTWDPSCRCSSSSLLDRLHLRPSTTTLMLGVERLTYALGHLHGSGEGDWAARLLLLGLLVDRHPARGGVAVVAGGPGLIVVMVLGRQLAAWYHRTTRVAGRCRSRPA